MPRGGAKPGERRGGRKAGVPNKATASLKALALPYTSEALQVLAAIMRSPEMPPPARVAACRELLDRGHGKAAQPVSLDGVPTVPLFTLPLGCAVSVSPLEKS